MDRTKKEFFLGEGGINICQDKNGPVAESFRKMEEMILFVSAMASEEITNPAGEMMKRLQIAAKESNVPSLVFALPSRIPYLGIL